GAWVLHTLRGLIGDDAFFAALRRMAYPDSTRLRATDGEQVRFVTTDDFLRIAEDESGCDLDWLFEVYLRQPALPELHAERGRGAAADGDVIRISWNAPAGLPFPMPVEVDIDGEVRVVEVGADGTAEIEVPAGARTELDPQGWILRANQGAVRP
ncbi:MAG TPA: metallopeptidase, partial [Gemmatimonadota bacterium]|nr:metallopeptidase [Gemmatimonadota bacterium]